MATFINETKHSISPTTVNKGIGAVWADTVATWADSLYGWADVQLITNVSKNSSTFTNVTKN